jgi:hypothetical protein
MIGLLLDARAMSFFFPRGISLSAGTVRNLGTDASRAACTFAVIGYHFPKLKLHKAVVFETRHSPIAEKNAAGLAATSCLLR